MIMSNKNTIGIKFEAFKFVSFNFVQQENIAADEVFNFEIAANIETDKSRIVVYVLVRVIRQSNEEEVAKAQTATLFSVYNTEPHVSEDGAITYPNSLLVTPVSLAISTTRGAILTKGAGTFLENIPLPIIDPKDFVPKVDDHIGDKKS